MKPHEAIPDVFDRFQADTDFRRAIECRDNARRELRWKMPAWRIMHRAELREAMRVWRHYKQAVRSIAQ